MHSLRVTARLSKTRLCQDSFFHFFTTFQVNLIIVNKRLKMANNRKFFVGGNWKMNGSKAKVDEILKFMNDANYNAEKVGKVIIVC